MIQPAATPLPKSFFARNYKAQSAQLDTFESYQGPTYALDTALGACKNGAYETKVLCAAPTRLSHVLESLSQLLFNGKLCEGISCRRHRCIVAHLIEMVSTYPQHFVGVHSWKPTLDMKRPNRPPSPNPMTPDMTVFAGHDSIACCI